MRYCLALLSGKEKVIWENNISAFPPMERQGTAVNIVIHGLFSIYITNVLENAVIVFVSCTDYI